ncbi:hypothetical protein EDD99_0946 [Streptomyces sp. 846.5]|nr:hypothetical protein [Streptomyces sp. 846.5]TDU02546.1 hypothetical protein EDD99_0946 [Streptomyces sp. 846.5]
MSRSRRVTTTGPATGATTSSLHSGTYATLLGSSSPTAGTTTLGFYCNVTCPDTVTYDGVTLS